MITISVPSFFYSLAAGTWSRPIDTFPPPWTALARHGQPRPVLCHEACVWRPHIRCGGLGDSSDLLRRYSAASREVRDGLGDSFGFLTQQILSASSSLVQRDKRHRDPDEQCADLWPNRRQWWQGAFPRATS